MASINFYQLPTLDQQKTYLYSDLHLDITEDTVVSKTKKTKSDILVDYDVQAVKNSITNLFGTRKGQRPLEPEYGINLDAYLFEPVSTTMAGRIGRDIATELKYEPRVTPLKINVTVLTSEDGYRVDLVLFIASLGVNTLVSVNISKLTGGAIVS